MPKIARKRAENMALSPKQELAALALATGCTREQAAMKSGAATRTVKEWLTQVMFKARVNELRSEFTERALNRLTSLMVDAATTLHELLTAESETVRLGSARAILELSVKLKESTELEMRISNLEQGRNGE